MLVCDDIRQFRQLAELRCEVVNNGIQLVLIGIFERVLIFGAADRIIDGQVLNRLHVKLDAGYIIELWAKTGYDAEGVDAPIVQRLEIDLNAPAVERCVRAIGADKR